MNDTIDKIKQIAEDNGMECIVFLAGEDLRNKRFMQMSINSRGKVIEFRSVQDFPPCAGILLNNPDFNQEALICYYGKFNPDIFRGIES